jgi:hypothetical protein
VLIDNTRHRYLHGFGWCRYECGGGFTSLSGLAIEAWERMTDGGVNGKHAEPWWCWNIQYRQQQTCALYAAFMREATHASR